MKRRLLDITSHPFIAITWHDKLDHARFTTVAVTAEVCDSEPALSDLLTPLEISERRAALAR